jgi:hypothetical protein
MELLGSVQRVHSSRMLLGSCSWGRVPRQGAARQRQRGSRAAMGCFVTVSSRQVPTMRAHTNRRE